LLEIHHGIPCDRPEHAVDLVEAQRLHHDEDRLGPLNVLSLCAKRELWTAVHRLPPVLNVVRFNAEIRVSL